MKRYISSRLLKRPVAGEVGAALTGRISTLFHAYPMTAHEAANPRADCPLEWAHAGLRPVVAGRGPPGRMITT